jgi:phytoene desaturase
VHIVVIGTGFGGLSAAIRLQARGHQVTMIERRDQPGGRASVLRRDGFTFDMGPTIITAPHLFEELFACARARMSEHVDLVQLDPAYTIRFPDGSAFRYSTSRERLRDEIARFDAHDGGAYDGFAAETERIFRAAMPLIDQPFHSLRSMLRLIPQLARLRADRTVAAVAYRHFRDERIRQVFSFHPLLIGGNPFATTAIYALIHPLEQAYGVWYARGGTGALVRALVDVFTAIGGTIAYGCEVTGIVVRPGTRLAEGVRLDDGRLVHADVVISNADAAVTSDRLVPADLRRWGRRVSRLAHSPSLFVLYFGTLTTHSSVAHHEILMGPRYRDLLADIFDRKVLAPDMAVYVHRPTATDASVAPAGRDAFYALVPVPHLGSSVDWERAGPRFRDALVDVLESRLLPGLRGQIISESSIDPRHFRDMLGSHLGAAFSVSPTLTQSAWLRPHNRSAAIENLYLVGAGTHPGAGLPGVVSSGKIVAEEISRRPA